MKKMKKDAIVAIIVLASAFMLSIAGCQEVSPSDGDIKSQSAEIGTEFPIVESQQTSKPAETQTPTVNWGITLSVKDATATGLTLVITQAGGEPTGKLEYGSEYSLSVLNDGVWDAVPYTVDGDIYWTLEAYMVPMGDTVERTIFWEHLYGSLSAGTYRINKSFTDFRDTGDYDTETYYAEFEIK